MVTPNTASKPVVVNASKPATPTDSPEVAALKAQLAAAQAALAAKPARTVRDPRPMHPDASGLTTFPVLMTITLNDGRELSFSFGKTDMQPGDRANPNTWAGSKKGGLNANVTGKIPESVFGTAHKIQVGCNLTVLSK